MLRPFGSLLLCLLVFLHRFLLFLGCLGLRLLLLLGRLLSLARTVWAGEDLRFSRYRPGKTTGDQQYESRKSLHKCPRNGRAYCRSYTKLRPGPSCESIAEHYTSNAQELAYLRNEFQSRPRPRTTHDSRGSDEYIAAFYKLTLVPDIEIGVAFLPRRHMSNRIAAYPRVAELSLLPVATLSEFP